MKKKLGFIALLCFILAPAPAFAQGPSPIPIIGRFAELELVPPQLQPVAQVSGSITGNTGLATYYYWVVANFASGNATPSGPARVFNAPNALNGSNFITVSWNPVPGATSYDLLRTVTPLLPNGAATIAVTTATTSTSFNDQGAALSSYTITTFAPGIARLTPSSKATDVLVNGLDKTFAGPNPWYDVTHPNYNAQGTAKTFSGATITSGSPTVTSTVAQFANAQPNQLLSVYAPPCVPPTIGSFANPGGTIPGNNSALGTAAQPFTVVYVKVTGHCPNGPGGASIEGPPSIEYAKVIISTSNITFTPTTVDTGASGMTQYNIYASASRPAASVTAGNLTWTSKTGSGTNSRTAGSSTALGIATYTFSAHGMSTGWHGSITGCANKTFNTYDTGPVTVIDANTFSIPEPGDLVTSSSATSCVLNYVQATTTAAHNLLPGQRINIFGETSGAYNGTWIIGAVPSSTTLEWAPSGPAQTPGASTGTATVTPYESSGLEGLISAGSAGCTTPAGTGCSPGTLYTISALPAVPAAPVPPYPAAGVAGSQPPKPNSFLQIGTVASVQSSTQLTASFNATNSAATAAEQAAVVITVGPDDGPALRSTNSALTAALGGTIELAPGSYLLSCGTDGYGLHLTGSGPTENWVNLQAQGWGGSANLSGFSNKQIANAELLTVGNCYPLGLGTAGTFFSTGPRVKNIAVRDGSGAGNALAGIVGYGLGHSGFENVWINDIPCGPALFLPAAGPNSFTQFNNFQNLTFINVGSGMVFAGGQLANNSIWGLSAIHSQCGAGFLSGQGLDIQGDGGGTGNYTAASNAFFGVQTNYFPEHLHVTDARFSVYGPTWHSEDTTNAPGIGAFQTTIGAIFDGSTTASCTNAEIVAPALVQMNLAIYVSPNCYNASFFDSTFTSNRITINDQGQNTSFPNGSLVGNLNLGCNLGNAICQWMTYTGTVNAGDLLCLVTGGNTVARCGSVNATAFVGVAGANPSTGATLQVAVITSGIATVNLDATVSSVVGDLVCSSAGTAYLGKENGTTACANGQQVGIVSTAATTLATATILIKLDGSAKFSATLSPVAVAANTCAEQIFAVTGIALGGFVYVNKPTAQAGLGIGGARVSSAGNVGINFCNNTAGSITPTASESYTFFETQ